MSMQQGLLRTLAASATALALTLGLGACTSAPATIDTQARSFDGLYPVRNTGSVSAWARADIDLSGYDALLLRGGGLRFRPPSRSGSETFAMDAEARSRLGALAETAFRRELGTVAGFSLATEPGPGVLVVQGTLVDIASNVPPERAGRSEVFLEDVGEATLVIELIDSESSAVLLRATQTRRAGSRNGFERSARARTWIEVERALDDWAEDLARAIERLHARFTIS